MATMKEVARKARVSTSTVSHVMNSTRAVSKDSRDRVLAAMAELHYIPSAIARSLRHDKTYTLGILIPNNSNPYFAEVIRGIEDESFRLGYNVILCNSDDDLKKQFNQIQVLLEKRVDGLILVSSGSDPQLAQLLSNKLFPKVLVDREVRDVVADLVETNHELGGYLATKHLLDLGHRAIACVAGPPQLVSSQDRVKGYQRAMAECRLFPQADHLIQGDFTCQSGHDAFAKLLALNPNLRPTAIFACNDLMAIGGMRALSAAGLRLPDQMSVVGYDDIALASYTNPPLTTVAQRKQEIGALSARILVDRIDDRARALRHEILQPHLINRQSSARLLDQ